MEKVIRLNTVSDGYNGTGQVIDLSSNGYTTDSAVSVYIANNLISSVNYEIFYSEEFNGYVLYLEECLQGYAIGSDITVVMTISDDTNNDNTGNSETESSLDIYVPSDYSDIADIPADLKKMADSIYKNLLKFCLKSETYSKEEVNSIIDNISTINILVVDALPTENISTTTIYFLLKDTSEDNDIYNEYIYVSNAWEKIGDTKIDLTEYVTIELLTQKLNEYLKITDLTTEVLKFVDNQIIENSTNPVSGGAVKTYVDTQIGNIEILLSEV